MSGVVLTCPACGTRYRSDPDSIGPNGRTVRCARCDEVWFEPGPDMVQPVTNPPVTDPPVTDPDALAYAENRQGGQTISESIVSGQESDVDHSPSAELDGAAMHEALTPAQVPPAPDQQPPAQAVGADVMMRDQADQAKLTKRRRTILFIWLVPLVIVIVAIVIAWTQRQAIVNRIPQMATLYQAIGVDVRAGGLKLDPPVARLEQENGVAVLRIETTLHNLTRETQTVPLIELTLHDDLGQALTQWYVETAQRQIEPRATIDVSTDYPNPPAGAVGVRYRLIGQSAEA